MSNYENFFRDLGDLDQILIFNRNKSSADISFFHLTQPSSGTFDNSFVILSRYGLKIVTSMLEKQAAEETGHEVLSFSSAGERDSIIKNELGAAKAVGLNYNALSVESFFEIQQMLGGMSFVDVSSNLANARMIKNPMEIEKLREANRIASEAFMTVISRIVEGNSESEVSGLLACEMMKEGASNTSFNGVIAFGENAAVPHHHPTSRKLKKGDFVVMDFGALYNRYCSDVTRTVVFGKASEEQREIYDIVLKAQDEGIRAVREGVTGKEVDSISRNIIDSSKYKGTFIHGLGHGVGLEVHDHPALSQTSSLVLKENMVITVEPGIYIRGVCGVRIEDDVLVHKSTAESMTKAPKELIEI